MSEWSKYLKEELKDPELCAEWDALEPEFAIIQAIIDTSKNDGITQKEELPKSKKY